MKFRSTAKPAERPNAAEIEIGGRTYIRRDRLASALQISERTLARWDACGMGPPRIRIRRCTLYDVRRLLDWLSDQQERSKVREHRDAS